jgi:amino acid transporter
VLYLGKFSPAMVAGWRAYAWSVAVVAGCSAWNLLGAPRVGKDSLWMSAVLMSPFAIFFGLCVWRAVTVHPAAHWGGRSAGAGLSTAILVAMWNYMGWDNVASVAVVAASYVLPLLAMALAGFSPGNFSTGDWATAAGAVGGPVLGLAVVAGGCITGVGMFNALVMSYTRLPMAMAQDGMLPRALKRTNRRGVPWVSVLACGVAWALAINLPFERLISIDLILYGTSLLLEFAALIVLRIREPELKRPFRAGNLAVACLLGVAPAGLIAYALYASRGEVMVGTTSAPLAAVAVGLLGPVLYFVTCGRRTREHLVHTAE